MNRNSASRTAIAVALLLLSVSAGCLQLFDGSDQNGTGTELGSYSLTAEKAQVATTPTSVIDFEEMTPRQQNTFERALNGSYNTARIPQGVDHEVWVNHRYVRYRNETYSVNVAVP